MASNLAVETDVADNLKPSESWSTEKIDGVVSLVMALWRAILKANAEDWYTPGCLTN